jgi:hypothetical protein
MQTPEGVSTNSRNQVTLSTGEMSAKSGRAYHPDTGCIYVTRILDGSSDIRIQHLPKKLLEPPRHSYLSGKRRSSFQVTNTKTFSFSQRAIIIIIIIILLYHYDSNALWSINQHTLTQVARFQVIFRDVMTFNLFVYSTHAVVPVPVAARSKA